MTVFLILISFCFLHAFAGGRSSTRMFSRKKEEGMVASEPSGENLGRSYVIGSSLRPCSWCSRSVQDGTEYDLPVHEVTLYSARQFGGNSKPSRGNGEFMQGLARSGALPVAC